MRRMYDENEIKSIASEAGGGKLYTHRVLFEDPVSPEITYYITVPSSDPTPITDETANRLLYGFLEAIDSSKKTYQSCTVKSVDNSDMSVVFIEGTLSSIAVPGRISADNVYER